MVACGVQQRRRSDERGDCSVLEMGVTGVGVVHRGRFSPRHAVSARDARGRNRGEAMYVVLRPPYSVAPQRSNRSAHRPVFNTKQRSTHSAEQPHVLCCRTCTSLAGRNCTSTTGGRSGSTVADAMAARSSATNQALARVTLPLPSRWRGCNVSTDRVATRTRQSGAQVGCSWPRSKSPPFLSARRGWTSSPALSAGAALCGLLCC